MNEEYFVYILKSLKNGRHYIGCTSNIENRLLEHNSGETKSIKRFLPYELIYHERYNTLVEARKREAFIKRKKSRVFIERLLQRGVA